MADEVDRLKMLDMNISPSSGRNHAPLSGVVLVLGAVGIWASNFTIVKYAVSHGFAPLAYTGLTSAVAGMTLCAIGLQRERAMRIKRKHLKRTFVLAFLGVAVSQTTFVYALRMSTASTIALLFGLGPVLVALVTSIGGSEVLGPRLWFSAGVSCLGVATVTAGSGGDMSGNIAGIALGLIAEVTWAVTTVGIASLMLHYSPLRLSGAMGLIGAIPIVILAIPQLVGMNWMHLGGRVWLAFAFNGFMAFGIANVLWFAAVRRIGPTRSTIISNLEPFLGALVAVVVFSEHLGVLKAVGGAFVALALMIAGSPRGANKPAVSPPL